MSHSVMHLTDSSSIVLTIITGQLQPLKLASPFQLVLLRLLPLLNREFSNIYILECELPSSLNFSALSHLCWWSFPVEKVDRLANCRIDVRTMNGASKTTRQNDRNLLGSHKMALISDRAQVPTIEYMFALRGHPQYSPLTTDAVDT